MNNKVYLIGNAHLDPVWLWEWYEGYAEVKATFRSALDRMKEFPDYKFTSACAAYYEWIREADPQMFEEIKARAKEGRWFITGGWYIQPDCNLPSGESYSRHALISQRFFKKEFGTVAKTGYNVDSFGHNGSIPKLLKNSGMSNYVFMRPMSHEKDLPDSLFLWKSADGSCVPAYRISYRYNINISTFNLFEEIAGMADRHPEMAFYGIGNHGGGPTVSLLRKMKNELDGRYVYSSPDEFFEAVKGTDIPVIDSDLQFHAKGCYTACSMIKRENRRSENALISCEKYSVLSSNLVGTVYPDEELRRGWKNLLFNQFHDILGGCCIKEAYESARIQLGETQSIAERNTNYALQQISWNIDTLSGQDVSAEKPEWGGHWLAEQVGTPIVVFNPHAWESTVFVRLRSEPVRMTDAQGNVLPIQRVRASRTNGAEDKWETGFVVTLPSLGYTVLRAFYEGERSEYEPRVRVSDDSIENELIRLTFNPKTGELSGITDKLSGKNMLSSETETVMMDETDSDTWAHGIKEFRKIAEIFTSGDIHVTESGPLRATMRTYQRGTNSVIRRDYSVVSGSRKISVKTVVDFHEKHRMLKFRIPVNIKEPAVLCDIPFGVAERPSDGTEQVCQKWFAAVSGDESLSVLNDSKYGFDCDGNVLSLTVLRGAIYADHYGARDKFCEYMEQGTNELTYAILVNGSVSDTVKAADELNQAPFTIMETFHGGTLGESYSGISVDADNIIVTAVKKHEDSDAVVVRAYECEDRDTDVNIKVMGFKTISARFGHSQVRTFIVTKDCVKETDFLEW